MNVGDIIDRDQARQLPVGAKFTDSDGSRPRTVTDGGYARDDQGGRPHRQWDGLPRRHFTITHLPDQPEFIIGQRVNTEIARRLPNGAVWVGEDGRERTVIAQGEAYRDPTGLPTTFNNWQGRYGRLASLPEAPKAGPQVGAVINGRTPEGKAALRALPEGTDTVVTLNDRHYVKSGDSMERIGDGGQVIRIDDFTGEVRVEWMPGMKKQAYTKHRVGQTQIDGSELQDLPIGAVVRGDNDGRERRIVAGKRFDFVDGAQAGYEVEYMTGPYTLVSLPEAEVKQAHGFTVGQQIPAAELGTLPVGTTFRAVGGTEDYLTVEGGDDRRGGGGPVTHYVRPGQGIVNGGGLYPLAELRGDFTIADLPEKAETLAEFKARVWRVTRPYANSDYTRGRTNALMERLGITEPVPEPVEDPALVQQFKDEMWNLIAGQAKDEGWCATWKKPLAELGVTEPKPQQITTTITVTHSPDIDPPSLIRDIDGIEVVR